MRIVRASELNYEPASHEPPENPGVLKKVLARKKDLLEGRIQMVNWSLCPQGSSFAKHYHEDMQEVFIILNGSVSMTVEEEQVFLGKGDVAIIEPREIHQMTNTCDQDVEYVVFGISLEQGGKTVIVA